MTDTTPEDITAPLQATALTGFYVLVRLDGAIETHYDKPADALLFRPPTPSDVVSAGHTASTEASQELLYARLTQPPVVEPTVTKARAKRAASKTK